MAINDYALLSDVQNALPDDSIAGSFNATYNVLLTSLITRASRKFDEWTNRKLGAYFVNATSTLYFDAPSASSAQVPYHDNRLGGGYGVGESRRLWIGELAAAPTSVSISLDGSFNYTALLSTDYILGPYNAPDDSEPYNWIDLDILYGHYQTWYGFRRGVQVVGPFGYSTTTPDVVKQAVIVQVARWFNRAKQRYQDIAVISDPNQNIYSKYDDDFLEAVDHYRKMAV